jgi:glycosyltransferase involved in cell wall biosynthesis
MREDATAHKIETSENSAYGFGHLVQPGTRKICVVSYEAIEEKNSGYSIRSSKVVESLSKVAEMVTVLEFPYDDTRLDTFQKDNIIFISLPGNRVNNKSITSIKFKKMLTFNPIQVITFELRSAIELFRYRKTISQSDLVVVEGALIPAANIIAKIYRKKVILDTHCVNKLIALGFKNRSRLVYGIRVVFWHIIESLVTKLSDLVVAVSAKDIEYLETEYHLHRSKLVLIPHVLESASVVTYTDKEISQIKEELKIADKKVVTFVGDLGAVQNYDAAQFIVSELAPRVLRNRNDVIFLIVGKGKELFTSNNSLYPGIIFTGFVDNLAKYMSISDVCIAPMRVGAGIITKVLDYSNYEKNILTTPIGAEGLENYLKPSQVCRIEDFSSCLVKTVEDISSKQERSTGQGSLPQSAQIRKLSSPLVSIVIPTKNSANTLGSTLESINNQTYRNYEIILVDNHSTDGTLTTAKRYTNKIHVMGPERTAQVNFGIKNAQGKYIYRIDSDWVLEPTVLEQAIKKCEEEGFDAILVHNSDDPTISFWGRVRKFERDMFQEDDLNVAARFIRKDIFDKVGCFDESMVAAEDYDLHNRILAAGYKIGRISAKETHIGAPGSFMDVIKKHYYYGTTLPVFLAKNPKRGMKQLSPLRPAYAKHWRLFFKHPIMTLGFLIYQIARYSSAIMGYAAVAAKTKHST